MDRLSRSGLVLIMLLGLLLPAGVSGQEAPAHEAALRLVETQADGLIFEVHVPLPDMEEVQVDGQVFQRLSLPGYLNAGVAGQPELPQTSVTLGIPTEGEIELRIVDAKIEELPGNYTVYPSPEHGVQRDPDSGAADPLAGVQEQFTWDAAAYTVDQFQPPAVVSVDETAFVRGQRIARVLIQPVQVNPAQGALRVYRYLRVEATFAGAPAGAVQANLDPDLFTPFLQDQLLNFDQARAWRSERGQPLSSGRTPDSVYPGDTSRTWFKTHLRHSGLYKVTLADLQDADLAPLAAANPAYLQVWAQGQQVAAHFVGDNDAQFESGEALLFYAQIEPTIYSETDVYWLSVGDTPGLRMTTRDATPAGAVTDTTAWTTTRLEEDYIFRTDLPRYGTVSPYPRWYWREVESYFTPSYTVYQSLPTAVTSGYTALLRVRLQGGSDTAAINPDHRVRVELNGQTVGVMTWDSFAPAQQEFQAPASWLQRGLNAVTLSLESIPGVGFDSAFLDWIEIDYQQSLLAINDQASFTAAGGGRREFQVQGFSVQDVLAFDVTDPAAPLRLTGLQAAPMAAPTRNLDATQVQVTAVASQHQVYLPIARSSGPASSAAYDVRFSRTSADPRSYSVVQVTTVNRVSPLSRDIGSALHSPTNRADYLLVAHRDLWSAAEALANHRRTRGLSVALVDIQDVYDEWSNGRMDPRAIRDFVAFAYGNWQAPAPSYLMLLGSAHYDYRMRTGLTMQPVLVPAYFACVDPWVCEVAVDNEFVTVSGSDRLPDLALGRLPARTLAEATVMVDKIISYESSPPLGAWTGTLTFVADNARSASGAPDPAGNFETLTNGIMTLVPAQYTANRIFYDPYPNDDSGEPYRYRTPSATTDAIVNAVNDGTVFLNYIGHASVTTWAHEAILRARDEGRNDVTRFANGPRQPIVLDMACVSGNFADPSFTGIEVLMLGWGAGGSIAGWGATGFGVATGHDQLHRGFYQSVFGSGVRALGLATSAGKQALWTSGRNLDLMDTFDLLGDPALHINLQPTLN
jgi:hypothetical protein